MARISGHANGASRRRPGHTGIDALFRLYRKTRDAHAHALLTQAHMRLVDQVLRRYSRTRPDADDLQQVGYIGLINAVAYYDPARGVPFEAYARHFIEGEIRHFLRDHGSLIRQPRWAYELSRRVTTAIADLTQEFGRPPTIPEIARRANIAEDGVLEILKAREAVRTVSLDAEREGEDGHPLPQQDRIASRNLVSFQLPVEDRIVVTQTLERLSEMQRKVIYCLFYQDLTQTQAASILGISQRHVSRLMTAGLRKMRDMLAGPQPKEVEDRAVEG